MHFKIRIKGIPVKETGVKETGIKKIRVKPLQSRGSLTKNTADLIFFACKGDQKLAKQVMETEFDGGVPKKWKPTHHPFPEAFNVSLPEMYSNALSSLSEPHQHDIVLDKISPSVIRHPKLPEVVTSMWKEVGASMPDWQLDTTGLDLRNEKDRILVKFTSSAGEQRQAANRGYRTIYGCVNGPDKKLVLDSGVEEISGKPLRDLIFKGYQDTVSHLISTIVKEAMTAVRKSKKRKHCGKE